MVKKLYHLVLRVIVLVTLVVPFDLVERVTRVVVFPLFVTFTVLRVIFAIFVKFIWLKFVICGATKPHIPKMQQITACLLQRE